MSVFMSIVSGNISAGAAIEQQIELVVLLLVITLFVALISRPLRLPYTLILVVVGLLIGILPILPQVHFDPDTVLFLFLPALLFEGAWNIDVKLLLADWLPIVLLAMPGLLLSVFIVAALVHLGIGLSWLLALLLGAMVAPTDPVAVLSLLRKMGLSERLSVIVEGESLFNDGVGAAIFEIVLAFLLPSLGLVMPENLSFWAVAGDALWLMFGGLALGLIVGWLVAQLLRTVDDFLIEMTITFCVAYGVYLLGVTLQTSGLLAIVCAGLVMGSYGRRKGMSQRTQEATQDIWEFIGYLANSLLFLLLGVQLGVSHYLQAIPGALWALLGVVVGRVLMIYLFIPLHDAIARKVAWKAGQSRHAIPVPRPIPNTWRPLLVFSGLRGALSIALVLSLPTAMAQSDLLEGIVYGVVLVTLLGQGMGLFLLLPRWQKEAGEEEIASTP
jgi:monovalent cation:H+ antiporter, CPA1 family